MTKSVLALHLHSSKIWQGGFNYQLSIISSLSEFFSDSVSIVVFVSSKHPASDLAELKALSTVTLIVDDIFSRKFSFVRSFLSLLLGFDPWIRFYIHKYRITSFFESAQFIGRNPGLDSVLSWIPDLQHRILPSNFSFLAWLRRRLVFDFNSHQIAHSYLVVLPLSPSSQISTFATLLLVLLLVFPYYLCRGS